MKILILADHWIEEELFLLEPVTVVPEEREYFVWNEDGLSFVAKQKTLWFDFLDKQLHFRLHHLSRKNELLFRALNLKLGERLLDLSAGGGIDSFIIANFGFEVLMIERHWVIYLLLKDALRRLRTLNRFKDLQLNLAFGEAVNYLDKSYPVVYFDPMFPKQNKSALNRQKMRFLGDLVGSDSDADQVARLALQKTHRLVIKRPRSVTPLLLDPALTYTGKSHRFDVYFNQCGESG